MKTTTLLFDIEKQWPDKDIMGGRRISWWIGGIIDGLNACSCEGCKVLIRMVEEKQNELFDKEKPRPTTKQYRITRTFLVTTKIDEDIDKVWSNVDDESNYEEDEKIEFIAEI